MEVVFTRPSRHHVSMHVRNLVSEYSYVYPRDSVHRAENPRAVLHVTEERRCEFRRNSIQVLVVFS